MGTILRDEPLCWGLTLRGYCHWEVGAGEIPTERVGMEGDRDREKGKEGTNRQKKKKQQRENRVQLKSQPEQGRQCGQSEVVSETEEAARS